MTSGILVGCTRPPFRPLWWAEIDGVVCHPGNAPQRLHSAYAHTSAGSLGTEPLAHTSQPSPWAVGFLPRARAPDSLTLLNIGTRTFPCRRPSVGNAEGYIRSPPLPPTLLLDRVRVDPVSTPARIRSTDLYVSCAGCSKNVQKHRCLQCFVAFGGHDFRLTGRRWCRLCVPRGQA